MKSVTTKMVMATRTTLIGTFFRRFNEFSSSKNVRSFSAVDCLFALLCFIRPHVIILSVRIAFCIANRRIDANSSVTLSRRSSGLERA